MIDNYKKANPNTGFIDSELMVFNKRYISYISGVL